MSIPRAKHIETVYEEVSPYDLVVVPDAPLASALNRRLDRPHLGPFATTPRRLAAGRRERAEDRQAFLELVNETDLGWKETAYAVGNVLQCWEHEGTVDTVLDYDAYVDAATETAVDRLRNLDTTSCRLSDYEIDDGRSVAVVGLDQLTPLERSVLPAEFDAFSPFEDDAFEYPPFHVFDSSTAIVGRLLDAVTADNADDAAIVLDRGSEYSTLVESALEAADVPFYGGPGFNDHPAHRTFLRLLRVAHGGSDARVREVQPILSRLGTTVDVEHAEKRLADIDLRGVDWLTNFCESIGRYTFADALDAFEAEAGRQLSAFREELQALDIADETVTGARLDSLEFYLQTYEVPVDRENEGVLLADAKAASYVERPVVFYVGLDENWTHSSPRRPWVDRDREYTRNLRQFQLLLQNGVEQYYLVQNARGGTPVMPCLYFEELLDEEYEEFLDLRSVSHTHSATTTGDGFERPADGEDAGGDDAVEVEPTTVDTISQSSLSTYVNCPRDYFFDRLVDTPDKDYLAEGNCFHDFAEFYVEHPEAVDVDAIAEIVDLMAAETRPFVRDVERDIRRASYALGIKTLRQFFAERRREPLSSLPATDGGGWGTNVVADHFGRSVDSPVAERWFENPDLGIKGKIDLIHAPHRLVDYKSGSQKSRSRVVGRAAIDPPSDTPDFQALLYLAQFRTMNPGERLEFTFVHFLEPLDDAVRGEIDIDDALTTVTYYPTTFEAFARSEEMFDRLLDDGPNDCQKTLSKATYDDYAAVFETCDLPATDDADELAAAEFGRTLETRLKDCVGDYKYVETACTQVLRELLRVRNRNFFDDDLDAFEAFVADRIDELNRRRAGEEPFPVDGLAGEPNYRYVDHRDLILRDD